MRCTRPRPDPSRLERARLGAIAGCILAIGAISASCSSEEKAADPPPNDERDGGNGNADASDGATVDAGRDAKDPLVDAGPPRTVHCAATPCAVALTSLSRLIYESDPRGGLVERLQSSFCVLLDSGRVACWGTNRRGELGRGDGPTTPSAKPMFVEGIETAREVAGTCAVLADQSVRCWGEGSYLQEDGIVSVHTVPVTLPIPPAKKIHVQKQLDYPGNDFGCAILASNELLCWGYPTDGNQTYLTNVDVENTSYAAAAPHVVRLPNGAVPIDVTVDDMPAGSELTVVRLASGEALSWGDQRSLGRASSLRVDPYPIPIELSGVTAVDIASENVCAVAGQKAYCWGHATDNVLGEGVPARALPENFPVGEPVVQIATGRELKGAQYQRACAVTRTGRVYCRGDNDRGQAGDGTRVFASVPVEVQGLPEPVVSIRVLPKATCALLESGRVSCWGDGTEGALGQGDLGTLSVKPLPVTLP